MNYISKLLTTSLIALSVVSCGGSDELDSEPQAVLTEDQVATTENIDALVIATYSYLGNDHYTAPNYLWPTGNLRAGDAHKGGNGPSDIFAYHALSMYEPLVPVENPEEGKAQRTPTRQLRVLQIVLRIYLRKN